MSFYGADGLKIAANLYPAQTGRSKKVPAVVLCQGLSGVKEKVLPEIASAFSKNGFETLAFDYRGFGESGNARKRPYLFPEERIDDVRSAVSFLQTLRHVDRKKIGLYGISYGGPVAIQAAAQDERARCVIVVSGPANGISFLKSLRNAAAWKKFLAAVDADRLCRVKVKKSKSVDLEFIVPFPASFWKKYRALGNENKSTSIPQSSARQSKPMLTLESAERMLLFSPEPFVRSISPRPILFIHGMRDNVAPYKDAVALFRKAGSPKKMIPFAGMDHIDLDSGEGLKRQIALSLKWMMSHLK